MNKSILDALSDAICESYELYKPQLLVDTKTTREARKTFCYIAREKFIIDYISIRDFLNIDIRTIEHYTRGQKLNIEHRRFDAVKHYTEVIKKVLSLP